MGSIEVQDGSHIYYKDSGKGQTVVFSHGWPLSAQSSDGNNIDTYANDLASLIDELDLMGALIRVTGDIIAI